MLGSSGISLSDGTGRFSYRQVIAAIKNARDMAVGDFNKDGKPDLAVINETFSILLNTTVGTDAVVFSEKSLDASSDSIGSLNINLGQKTLQIGAIAQSINGDYNGVVGTRQADKIVGSKNVDYLSGEAGNDALMGLDGKDKIIGGKGSDTLTGGKGKDKFEFSNGSSAYDANAVGADVVFNQSYGVDKITDFVSGQCIYSLKRTSQFCYGEKPKCR